LCQRQEENFFFVQLQNSDVWFLILIRLVLWNAGRSADCPKSIAVTDGSTFSRGGTD